MNKKCVKMLSKELKNETKNCKWTLYTNIMNNRSLKFTRIDNNWNYFHLAYI